MRRGPPASRAATADFSSPDPVVHAVEVRGLVKRHGEFEAVRGVLFTAIFSAISIVWDREFGFMREMLVAPVRRSSLVIGKCLGGATVATGQGIVMLCLAGAVGIPHNVTLLPS